MAYCADRAAALPFVEARDEADTTRRVVSETVEDELRRVVAAWDRAMVTNDADAIGRYMADDWVIIGPDGGVGDKPTFLSLVASGALTHDVMESHDVDVRPYGDAAVVVARGISGGAFQGRPFYLVERASSVFVRQADAWRCVSTHLSLIAGSPAAGGEPSSDGPPPDLAT